MDWKKPGGFALLILIASGARAEGAAGRAQQPLLPPRYPRIALPADFRQIPKQNPYALERSQHLAIDSGFGELTLDASHARTGIGRSRNLIRVQQAASRWRMDVAYLMRPFDHEAVRIGASFLSDRRKPTIPLDRARWLGSSARAISIGWQHDERFLIDGGWFENRSVSGRSPIDRAITIASGASIAERGPRLKAEFTPGGRAGGMTFGVETGAMTIDANDQRALDMRQRRDLRATMSLRLAFAR
ncbi:hypothetical protein [Sphingomonas sp.]|uniref:hypothetical protein n=1 Tax=Sphingomonas sp. TaxID=28214 RepID=UPI000DB3C99B|nr:hypothetical protein [Sphingomonas sp.]PZU09062.1 MAG: hypothetical protein DI605_09755 [Sphingomonas sp.]